MASRSVWTVAESRAEDAWAAARGVPPLSLMELAGARAADFLVGEGLPGRILVLVGPGANGGDGLVAVRHLARHTDVRFALMGGMPRFAGAEGLLRAAMAYGARMVPETEFAELDADWVVDAVFGTGFHGTLGDAIGVWDRIAARGTPVYALDILSGMDGDSGEYAGPVTAAATLTFGATKWGHWGYPGAARSGRIAVLDIGLRESGLPVGGQWMAAGWARARLPRLGVLGHKYRRGRVMVVGGSAAMAGAPQLAAEAALRTGAGLVDMLVPRGILSRLAVPAPIMVRGCRETADHALNPGPQDWEYLARADVIVFGPGLGTSVGAELLRDVLALGKMTVIDADGLRLLPGIDRKAGGGKVILTPHSGEAARLLDTTAEAVDRDRRQALGQLVQRYRAGVVLKGCCTLTGSGGMVTVNTSGGPELATAGSGDVLAGVVGALAAQGLDSDAAMALGAYAHGWAGDLAAARLGRGMTAKDVIDALPRAWRRIEQAVPARRAPVDGRGQPIG